MKKSAILLVITLPLLMFCCIQQEKKNRPDTPALLDEMAATVDSAWNQLNKDLQESAAGIASSGLERKGINEVLNSLLAKHSFIVDAAFVDTKGIMQVIQPEFFKKHEGTDISNQSQVMDLMKNRKPVMSPVFLAVEGFYAVDVEFPVMKGQEYLGSVSALIRPESFLGQIIAPRIKGMPLAMEAFDTLGRILWDVDIEEIGKMALTDTLYKPFPEVTEAMKRIIGQKEGKTTYAFMNVQQKKKVKKEIFWTTVVNHGIPWRLALNSAISEGTSAALTLSDLGIKELNQSFRFFGTRSDLLQAVDQGDKAAVLKLFEAFYKAHPGLYCVELLDTGLMVPYGYPPENSLDNYRFDPSKDKPAKYFLEALRDHNETIFENPLFEGRTGIFMAYPLVLNKKFLGMVYYIRIKP